MSDDISDSMKQELLNIKSKSVYDRWYQHYQGFCENRNLQFTNFGSFMDYAAFLGEHYKCSTVWQACSCINKYLKVFHSTDDFVKKDNFKLLMKKMEKNYVPKKSAVFTLDDVFNILQSDLNVTIKVAMVVGVYGGLRTSELEHLTFENVSFENGVFKIVVTSSKTDPGGHGHYFFVSPCATVGQCPVTLLHSYIECFEMKERTGRFFRMISNGKGQLQSIAV